MASRRCDLVQFCGLFSFDILVSGFRDELVETTALLKAPYVNIPVACKILF
jgi:hypothetical protein